MDNATWFSPATADAPVRLFCFPFAGGNAAAFQPWRPLLAPAVDLRVALLPGRGARLFEQPLRELDELVAHLAGAVAELADRPFALFGHSLGALLAFEVTRELRRGRRPLPGSLWVAAAEGPRTRLVKHRIHDLPDAELVDALRDYNGSPPELLADEEMMELLMPGLRADFALDEQYVYSEEAPLDLPIHLLCGDRDPYVELPRAAGWARESTRPLHQHRYDGDHFFIHAHQAAITAELVATVAADRVGGHP